MEARVVWPIQDKPCEVQDNGDLDFRVPGGTAAHLGREPRQQGFGFGKTPLRPKEVGTAEASFSRRLVA